MTINEAYKDKKYELACLEYNRNAEIVNTVLNIGVIITTFVLIIITSILIFNKTKKKKIKKVNHM